ncbi:MAG TPA: carboxypeptidase-like regulatory domain-containing protein, partial [Thermoanaerobaculia bacterium]|nr:carboxypeptidase-like regulatory domain-containing protein [Thermoanaerobaculia bacterium]
MKRLLLLLCVALGARAATISGVVTNESGSPLAAMTVAAYTSSGALQTTGATTGSGTYALTLPAGSYRLLAYDTHGAYATSFHRDAESFETSAVVTPTSSQNLTGIDFRLVHAGFIVGSAGLPNLTVAAYNLSGTRRGFTTTDGAGNFVLAVPPGSYKVAAYDESLQYATTFYDAATSFSVATVVSVAATQSVVIALQLPRAAKLAGTITSRETLAPLASMRVVVYAQDGSRIGETLTGSDGRYALAARPGSLRVVVDDPAGNYATTYVPDAQSFSTSPLLTAEAGTSTTVNASMTRGGRIAGRIVDRISGAPLAGITAVAYNADATMRATAVSDAAGAYSLLVPPGDYRVGVFDAALVHLPQYASNAETFSVARVVRVLAQQSVTGVDFAPARGARVSGSATSRATAAPLRGITVGAYDAAGRLVASGITDAAGRYALLVDTGAYTLVAFDPALAYGNVYYASAPLTLTAGQSLTADFALPAAGRIRGSVTDANGAPLAGIEVLAYDTAGALAAATTTDGGGEFRLATGAGTYTIAVVDPTQRYASAVHPQTITVAAGEDAGAIQIALPAASAP